MANSATLTATLPLLNTGATAYQYDLVYDTITTVLTVRAGSTGKILCIAGLTYSPNANAAVRLYDGAAAYINFAAGANSVISVPFTPRNPSLLMVGTAGNAVGIYSTQLGVASEGGQMWVIEFDSQTIMNKFFSPRYELL